MVKNKRGWLKIVEAFISILLIMVVALIVIGRGQAQETKIDEKIYGIQTDILRELVINNRNFVEDFNDYEINTIVDSRTPNYLNCDALTCGIQGDCDITSILPDEAEESKNIYVQTIPLIGGEEEVKLTLACWI